MSIFSVLRLVPAVLKLWRFQIVIEQKPQKNLIIYVAKLFKASPETYWSCSIFTKRYKLSSFIYIRDGTMHTLLGFKFIAIPNERVSIREINCKWRICSTTSSGRTRSFPYPCLPVLCDRPCPVRLGTCEADAPRGSSYVCFCCCCLP